MTVYPIGYGTRMVPLNELMAAHRPKMHPEYARRLFAWIEAQQGRIGIGSGWRETQPQKPGVAPEGQSFHQSQTFASGLVAYCAVDLVVAVPGAVHRAPTWSEVPAQGSSEATLWGVHSNVGSPSQVGSEPWHMQPVEIDGWQSWVNAGRPDPTPPPAPEPEEPAVTRYFKLAADQLTIWATADDLTAHRLDGSTAEARGVDPFTVPVLASAEAAKLTYHGGLPYASVR